MTCCQQRHVAADLGLAVAIAGSVPLGPANANRRALGATETGVQRAGQAGHVIARPGDRAGEASSSINADAHSSGGVYSIEEIAT